MVQLFAGAVNNKGNYSGAEAEGQSVQKNHLCPVAGPAGDHFPHALIELLAVFFDGKIFAAHRAAYGDHPSTEVEHGFLAAGPAFHKNLKKQESVVRSQ